MRDEWVKNCTKEIIRRYIEEINKKYNGDKKPYTWKRKLIQAIGLLAFNFALVNADYHDGGMFRNNVEFKPLRTMSYYTDNAYSIKELKFIQINMINLLKGRFCPKYMKEPGGIMRKIDKKESGGQYSDLAKKVLSKQQQKKNVGQREQERLEKSISKTLFKKISAVAAKSNIISGPAPSDDDL